jgi:hypothetical protein
MSCRAASSDGSSAWIRIMRRGWVCGRRLAHMIHAISHPTFLRVRDRNDVVGDRQGAGCEVGVQVQLRLLIASANVMWQAVGGRWSWHKRLTSAVLLAIAILTVGDFVSHSWPFALPATAASHVARKLARGLGSGTDTDGMICSWRGILMRPTTLMVASATDHPSNQGMLVEQVEADSPAAAAKLRSGDVITALDGMPVSTVRSLALAVADHCCGPTVALSVWREHHPRTIEVRPVTPPSETVVSPRVQQERTG